MYVTQCSGFLSKKNTFFMNQLFYNYYNNEKIFLSYGGGLYY